jgi:hypothetical protein
MLKKRAASFDNIAQHVQHLYFDIQQQIWSIHVLNFYRGEIDKLVEFLQQQKNEENVEILDDDIAALENIKARMVYDRAFIDALSNDITLRLKEETIFSICNKAQI